MGAENPEEANFANRLLDALTGSVKELTAIASATATDVALINNNVGHLVAAHEETNRKISRAFNEIAENRSEITTVMDRTQILSNDFYGVDGRGDGVKDCVKKNSAEIQVIKGQISEALGFAAEIEPYQPKLIKIIEKFSDIDTDVAGLKKWQENQDREIEHNRQRAADAKQAAIEAKQADEEKRAAQKIIDDAAAAARTRRQNWVLGIGGLLLTAFSVLWPIYHPAQPIDVTPEITATPDMTR